MKIRPSFRIATFALAFIGISVAGCELRRIRPDLPVVITSGYITEEVRERALQEGVRQVVYKPNTVDELCQSIHELLTGETGRG